MCRDGLGLGRLGAPGYRAHSSVAMAPMFKGIRFGSIIFAGTFEKWGPIWFLQRVKGKWEHKYRFAPLRKKTGSINKQINK